MKEIIFDQLTAQGDIQGVLRIVKNLLFFKVNNNEYSRLMLESLEKKGAIITYSAKKDWIQVDIFKDLELVKLGNNELNFKESSNNEIEEFICNFYAEQYKKLNFNVKVI